LGNIAKLTAKEHHQLLVLTEVHRQQSELFNEKKRSVANRIVNAAQPHIRPIVRGKIGKPTEFGAKISAAVVDGFAYLDRISFDSYNESEDLPAQIKAYKKRYGKYPKRVLADQIYRTRKNKNICKELGISLSGKPLGRPPKIGFSKEEKAQWKLDECERVPIEGKFGQLKRRFSLGRVMAKLAQTSETVIRIAFLVVNLEKILFRWIEILFIWMIKDRWTSVNRLFVQ
jgi:IS5 family transposase